MWNIWAQTVFGKKPLIPEWAVSGAQLSHLERDTEPAGQVQDAGIREIQDWNQHHRWASLVRHVLQTFCKP
ncbi:hypothetical protein JZ751_003043 [Albula glossodonta]|uniref:Uncharacterized protein n=1 Tax=Albula glossodonta TaxID=121402 RepID=A0A8T2N8K7_9TELE|nr:hypothetical protein JZ751_003043 [Albula glossodonta]